MYGAGGGGGGIILNLQLCYTTKILFGDRPPTVGIGTRLKNVTTRAR